MLSTSGVYCGPLCSTVPMPGNGEPMRASINDLGIDTVTNDANRMARNARHLLCHARLATACDVRQTMRTAGRRVDLEGEQLLRPPHSTVWQAGERRARGGREAGQRRTRGEHRTGRYGGRGGPRR